VLENLGWAEPMSQEVEVRRTAFTANLS
jgi:hypothetical protein